MGEFTAAATALVENAGQTTSTETPPEQTETQSVAETQDASTDASSTAPGSDPSDPKKTAVAPSTAAKPSAPPRTTPAAGQPSGDVAKALKESRDQTRKWKDTYSWLPQTEVPAMRDFYQGLRTNAPEAVGAVVNDLLRSNEYGKQMRSVLGRLLGTGGTQAPTGAEQPPAEGDPEPKPDFRLKDGTPFMSELRRREWQAWADRQSEKKFSERLKPFERMAAEHALQKEHAAASKRAQTYAAEALEEMKAYPHFMENIDAINEKYGELSQRMDGRNALKSAYLSVLHEQVLPRVSQRQVTAAELQRKTGATTPNPARPTALSGQKPPTSFREALEQRYGVA